MVNYRAVPYIIFAIAFLLAVLAPDFTPTYEIPLLLILAPIGVLAYLKGEGVPDNENPPTNN